MAEEGFKRKLAAIISADAVGYSRLMGEDEVSTVRTLESYRKVMADLIDHYRGRVVDSPGDNLLAEFNSVVDAVQCAVEIHEVLRAKNEELPEERRMRFRMGVNLGDVIEEGDRIYGDGVNIAARLEGLAQPGGICISGSAHEQIKNKLALGYEYIGEHSVKNIAEPLKVYRVPVGPMAVTPKAGKEKKAKLKKWQWAALCAVALVLAVGAALIWNFYFRLPKVEPASVERMAYPLPDKPSIAVLPFANLSDDPAQEYIADGLTENIIAALSQIPQMFVIAGNSTFTYKGKPVKISQVAEDLGVRYVLEGSVQKSGEQLRVTAQLIDAMSGYHLWAQRYDRDFKDLFALQDEITLKIAVALSVELAEGDVARIRHRSTNNLEAWSNAVKAFTYVGSSGPNKEAIIKARALLERAVELDPGYAWAWLELARTHFLDARFGFSASREESYKRSVDLTKKALALDETLPGGHSTLAMLYLFKKQHAKVAVSLQKAIALGPNDWFIHAQAGQAMHYAGRFDEALRLLKLSMRLNPRYGPIVLRFLGGAYRHTGQFKEAIEAFKEELERSKGQSNEFLPNLHLASIYGELGRIEEAEAHVKAALDIKPDVSIAWMRKYLSVFRDPAHAERVIDGLRKAGLPE